MTDETAPKDLRDQAPRLLPARLIENDAQALQAAHEVAGLAVAKRRYATANDACPGRNWNSSPASAWAASAFPAPMAARRFPT